MEKLAAQLADKYSPEQLIELMTYLWVDYIEVNKANVFEFINKFGPEVKEEFISLIKHSQVD